MARKRPHLKAPVSLGNILTQGFGGKRYARLIDLYRVQRAWDEMVGEPLSRCSFPKRVHGACLVVGVENAAWAQQLSMMRENVLSAIETNLKIHFDDVRFVNEPLPVRKISE